MTGQTSVNTSSFSKREVCVYAAAHGKMCRKNIKEVILKIIVKR